MKRTSGVMSIVLLQGLIFVAIAFVPSAAHAAFPGDNGKIAFARTGDIWVMNPDGSGQTDLTPGGAPASFPAWSADGTRLAFVRALGGHNQIFVMNADGTGQT